jgi:uncharacterized protein YdaU (DUF1376 family)
MIFYQRHIGDHMKDTCHLSILEHGVFNLLLDRFYATEKPMTRQEAFGVVKPVTKLEREAVARVLSDLFIATKEGYVNERALQEIEKYHEKRDKARQSAFTRWKGKPAEKRTNSDTDVMRTHSERNAKAMLSNNHNPISNNQNTNLVSIKDLLGERVKR